MNYGKNQQALLNFLHKHPNKWHRIKRRKAIDASLSLKRKRIGVSTVKIIKSGWVYVCFTMPQMLIKQN